MRVVRFFQAAFRIFQEAGRNFGRDNGAILAGAMAFFAMLTTAPLLVVAVAIAGWVVGEETAQEELRVQLEGPLGPDAASLLSRLMHATAQAGQGWRAAAIGFAVVAFAASRLFAQLQTALNHVWGVQVIPANLRGSAWSLFRKRLWSFAMVLVCGASLTIFLIARTVVTAMAGVLYDVLPLPFLFQALELATSFTVLTVLLAILYKLLPDVRIAWRDVAVGAAVTALLLGIGTMPIGLYLRTAGVASTYGAAGSLVVLLIWVYYSAQIFFFGAEVTEAWARRFGHGIEPEPYATRLTSGGVTSVGE